MVYLRARYYHPALGRFLTQDSLIPDVTNGQALNPYAYVYNDPVNMVDPSGNIPGLGGVGRAIGDAAVGAAKRAPDVWKPWIRDQAQAGNEFINDWYSPPDDCQCNNQQGGLFGLTSENVGGPLNYATQAVGALPLNRPEKLAPYTPLSVRNRGTTYKAIALQKM